MTGYPPQILTDASNAFAHHAMRVRVPAVIREVRRRNPDYPASIGQALQQLAADIERDQPVPALDPLAPDYDLWASACAEHQGHTWLHTDWFFAEIYFYRYLLQVVRWWETGRDPFLPWKMEELASASLWAVLDRALELDESSPGERLMALLHYALWGNRIDLSFAPSLAHGSLGDSADLLTDDSPAAVQHLLERFDAAHIIVDNTGTELALDLALAAALLETSAEALVLHVKLHPTFVSDATAADVAMLIAAMQDAARSRSVQLLGQRLQSFFDQGRLHLAPDFYWNSSRPLQMMPERLFRVFEQAGVVISKGDVNYRRLVGDIIWPSEMPFAQVSAYFPAPLLTLRTMKSDPVVGLRAGQAAQLDALDPLWRVNGRRGVIHFRA